MNSPAMPSTRTYALGVGRIPEFRLVYQPIFKVGPEGESEPFAYEALLRVEEEGILASANNHILHHEGLGSITTIDRWVLEQANLFLASSPGSKVWLNASRVSLCNSDYVDDVLRVVSMGPYYGRITLEVTESGEVDSGDLDASLHRLCDAGVEIVIDDLGDGFNQDEMLEASYVRGCKFSCTTLERLLMCEQTRQKVSNLVASCKSSNKLVVIEGIESAENLTMARQLGFDLFQGWLFGKPVHL